LAEARRLYLPDFCAPRAVLAVLLIVALTSLLLALSRAGFGADLWTELARSSLFLVWVGLASAAVLCLVRRPIARLGIGSATLVVMLLIAMLVAIVSEVSWRLGEIAVPLGEVGSRGIFPAEHLSFVLRNVSMGLLITGIALRYLYVAQQWRVSVESQARARVNALQSRIRPHFLYNSMNTIAALTRSDPSLAEEAVQDLADLFRANLNESRMEITLKEELEVARIYQRIEQLRLGERLKVLWLVQELPMRARVPSLTVQPLLENAIGHGVEPRTEGGTVVVTGGTDGQDVVLTVRNPLPSEDAAVPARAGHGLALANIRERFELLYGARARVTAGRDGADFVVELRFPHVETDRSPGG
jgi:two-component system sensor histidine kinase AlgZ